MPPGTLPTLVQAPIEQSRGKGSPAATHRALLALILFGIAFGYVEASVVTYLRDLYAPLHEQVQPSRSPNDLFPLLRLEQFQAAGPRAMRWLGTELFRELATL